MVNHFLLQLHDEDQEKNSGVLEKRAELHTQGLCQTY